MNFAWNAWAPCFLLAEILMLMNFLMSRLFNLLVHGHIFRLITFHTVSHTRIWGDVKKRYDKWRKGKTINRALNHYGDVETLQGAPNGCGGFGKVPTMSRVLSPIQYTFASERPQVRHERGGAKIASCLRRHKSSLRPWLKFCSRH